MTEATIETIEERAKVYAEARAALEKEVALTEKRIGEVEARHLPKIRELLHAASAAEDELLSDVGARQDLFARPKTRLFHGIRVGWKKAKGKVSFADGDAVVKRIRRHMPERFDDLVKTSEKPIKDALGRLSGVELKRIGVTVTADGDEPIAAPTDGAVDKIVKALLESARETS